MSRYTVICRMMISVPRQVLGNRPKVQTLPKLVHDLRYPVDQCIGLSAATPLQVSQGVQAMSWEVRGDGRWRGKMEEINPWISAFPCFFQRELRLAAPFVNTVKIVVWPILGRKQKLYLRYLSIAFHFI